MSLISLGHNTDPQRAGCVCRGPAGRSCLLGQVDSGVRKPGGSCSLPRLPRRQGPGGQSSPGGSCHRPQLKWGSPACTPRRASRTPVSMAQHTWGTARFVVPCEPAALLQAVTQGPGSRQPLVPPSPARGLCSRYRAKLVGRCTWRLSCTKEKWHGSLLSPSHWPNPGPGQGLETWPNSAQNKRNP